MPNIIANGKKNKMNKDSPISQVSLVSISLRPIMYQMQAIQCATRANTDISKVSTMALYCE